MGDVRSCPSPRTAGRGGRPTSAVSADGAAARRPRRRSYRRPRPAVRPARSGRRAGARRSGRAHRPGRRPGADRRAGGRPHRGWSRRRGGCAPRRRWRPAGSRRASPATATRTRGCRAGRWPAPSGVVMIRTSASGWLRAGWEAGRAPLPLTTASGGGSAVPVTRSAVGGELSGQLRERGARGPLVVGVVAQRAGPDQDAVGGAAEQGHDEAVGGVVEAHGDRALAAPLRRRR